MGHRIWSMEHWEYEGGTATPFIAYAPFIKQHIHGDQPAHIIDLMATCLDVAGVPYPEIYKGNAIIPTESVSLLPLMKQEKWKSHDALFFEYEGHRAV